MFHIYFLDYQDNRAGNTWPNTDEVINHEPNIDQYKVTEEQTNIGQHRHMLERNECDRVCSKNEIPKTCHFKFIIEQHTSMGKVAVPRFIISHVFKKRKILANYINYLFLIPNVRLVTTVLWTRMVN